MIRIFKRFSDPDKVELVKYRGPEDAKYSFFWIYDNVVTTEYFSTREDAGKWLEQMLEHTMVKVNGGED